MTWNQGRSELQDLLADRRLQLVPPSRPHADRLLDQARRHVRTAEREAHEDPEAAYPGAEAPLLTGSNVLEDLGKVEAIIDVAGQVLDRMSPF